MSNEQIAMELTKAYISDKGLNLKIDEIVKLYFEFLYHVNNERSGMV